MRRFNSVTISQTLVRLSFVSSLPAAHFQSANNLISSDRHSNLQFSEVHVPSSRTKRTEIVIILGETGNDWIVDSLDQFHLPRLRLTLSNRHQSGGDIGNQSCFNCIQKIYTAAKHTWDDVHCQSQIAPNQGSPKNNQRLQKTRPSENLQTL